ncbi:MAG: CorA family divalent cation transporter [Candidatus Micrarchaeota archaeon]|nr:CorA family divalent cation transporter [Candidatus Micrarchaeota archaeon]
MKLKPIHKIKNSRHSNGVVLALEERGFCAVICKNKTQCAESSKIESFYPLIKNASIGWIDFVIDDFEKGAIEEATKLGFSKLLVKNLIKHPRSGYEDFNDEMGLKIPAIHVDGFNVSLDPLLILIRKNMIVTLHTSETKRFFRVRRYAETLLRKLPKEASQQDKITLLLVRIIGENNARNFDYLQIIEETGDALSQKLSDTFTPREQLSKEIYHMKHALIQYLGGLWATSDALVSLRHGDADLLTDDEKILGRITGLLSDVHSQIDLAEHLSDVLASGMEVLQSIYNNQLQILNNRLALLVGYLTIIGTALLVPNTIATVLGNSAFNMGESDVGWYLALLLISTIFSTILAWWWVKKMGFLPRGPDVG